jgi:hypothetical protein
MATKAEEIYNRTHALMDQGMSRTQAFDKIAEEEQRPKDSIRGAFYAHKKVLEGGGSKPRTRRRETTEADALADARASLERSIAAIDKEVEASKARAEESKAEYESLRDSAKERKDAISTRLEALT